MTPEQTGKASRTSKTNESRNGKQHHANANERERHTQTVKTNIHEQKHAHSNTKHSNLSKSDQTPAVHSKRPKHATKKTSQRN